MFRSVHFKRACICCLLLGLTTLPSLALVQPRVYQWRMRLKKSFTPEVYAQTLALGNALTPEVTPEELDSLAQTLANAYKGTYHPATLRTALAIHVLLRHDAECNAAKKRWKQCKTAIGLCEKYLDRLEETIEQTDSSSRSYRGHSQLQGTATTARPTPPSINAAQYEPLPEKLDDEYWHQRVQLPRFEQSTERSILLSYRDSARRQLEKLEILKEELDQEYHLIDELGKPLRFYTLEQCDRLDPQTNRPYIDGKPAVNVVP